MERKSAVLHLLLSVAALSLSLWCVHGATTLPKPVRLEWHYYKVHNICDDAERFIKHQVKVYWQKDKTITAKFARLLYSDCFVTGCDASILLDGPDSEKTARQNVGLGAFVIIDKIKTVLEHYCPGAVSCADILNLATRDAFALAGAPSYPLFTGRKDGFTSKASSVDLPSPSMSHDQALSYFRSKGLDVLDMTTLLGAHSMGQVWCWRIRDRLYNYNNTGKADPTMDPSLLSDLQKQCPKKHGTHDAQVWLNTDPDTGSKYQFTNTFYQRVLANKAVLGVDQQLLYGEDTKEIAREFADNFEDWRRSFALSMARLGSINVLTGSNGEVRRNCHYTNKDNPDLK